MLTDPEAEGATKMLDFPDRLVEIPSTGERVRIDYDDIRAALNPAIEPTDEKGLHIRDCFDSLFYYFAAFEHYIASTLILPEDVEYPLDYYLTLLVDLRPEVNTYLRAFNLHRAEALLRRYPIWTNSPNPIARENTVSNHELLTQNNPRAQSLRRESRSAIS